MTIPIEQMMGGLAPEHELFFASRPENPEMRESTSVWIYEEGGEFAFPRCGIEAVASSWDKHQVHASFSFADGRVLDGHGEGAPHSPFGPDGRPTVLGAGPLSFRCIEPFRKWRVIFDGAAVDGRLSEMIAGALDADRRIPVRFEVEMTMATPCWVQDNSPEKVAKLTGAKADDALAMGLGWRLEHLFRGDGVYTVDGKSRDFKAVGSRIKRQSVRGLGGFHGHCWQSALFPDGRAFGFIAYPPLADGTPAYNEGYVYQDGRMYPARAVKAPWLRRIGSGSDDVSLELESDLGVTRISAMTALTTIRPEQPMPSYYLHQGGARYTWDGLSAYGMIERSGPASQMTFS
jgi:hypothetical protein